MKKELTSLSTESLLLRPIVESDLGNIFLGLSNPMVTQHYAVHYDSLEATQDQMAWYREPEQYWWAICSPDNATFFGAGGLNDRSQAHKKAEIGLWLLPDYWGKGIMTMAMPLICNYGFEQLGLHRIEGFVESTNTNCNRAMAKLDFKLEGTMQDCELKNGQFISIDIYAKFNIG
ncbi:MAG: GNAT family N-acetyltransferase [Bacteroidota bacterium]